MLEDVNTDVRVVFSDYPMGKFARKRDWWLSPAGLEVIAGWRQCGATIGDIYRKMGVDPRTFGAWRKICPQLEDILTIGQEVTNSRVVGALFKRALGYEYDEIIRELVEGEMRITRIVTKHVPPDVKACLSWLFNRSSDVWRAIQPPQDTDTPTLVAADGVLVTIREAAEKADEAASDAGSGVDSYPDERPEEVLSKPSENKL